MPLLLKSQLVSADLLAHGSRLTVTARCTFPGLRHLKLGLSFLHSVNARLSCIRNITISLLFHSTPIGGDERQSGSRCTESLVQALSAKWTVLCTRGKLLTVLLNCSRSA